MYRIGCFGGISIQPEGAYSISCMSFNICHSLQRVEQQEKEDQEMYVKSKAGRSQQQKKKPSKPAKKTENKPKTLATNEQEKKNMQNKSKETAPKKENKSDDSWEFDDIDAGPPVRSLADRLAQRQSQKLPISFTSSLAGSGAETTSSPAAKGKTQSSLEVFSSKKKVRKAAESDDDFIMEFSDEEDGPPVEKRAARSRPAKVCVVIYC